MSCERSNFCIGIRVGEGEKLSNAVFLVGINCFRVFPKRGHVPLPANPVSPTPELQIDTEKAATEIILYRAGRITSSTSNLIQSTVKKSFSRQEDHRSGPVKCKLHGQPRPWGPR
jgi:hypothetical protein